MLVENPHRISEAESLPSTGTIFEVPSVAGREALAKLILERGISDSALHVGAELMLGRSSEDVIKALDATPPPTRFVALREMQVAQRVSKRP
jgi:hypothetical protein